MSTDIVDVMLATGDMLHFEKLVHLFNQASFVILNI